MLRIVRMLMVENQELRNIPLSSLKKAPYNIRDAAASAISMDELARTIKNEGVLEPLLVNELNHGEYEIIAGSRRAEAAEKAGKETVPCLVMSVTSTHAQYLSIIENIQRQNLNEVERARVVEKIVERFDGNKTKAAEALGFSTPKIISEWLAPLQLEPEALRILKPVVGHSMTRRMALLSTVPRERQNAVAEILNEKARDESQIRKIVSAVKEHPTEEPRALVERIEKIPKPISVQVFLHEKLNNALELACQKERLSKSHLIQKIVEDKLTQEGYFAKAEAA